MEQECIVSADGDAHTPFAHTGAAATVLASTHGERTHFPCMYARMMFVKIEQDFVLFLVTAMDSSMRVQQRHL